MLERLNNPPARLYAEVPLPPMPVGCTIPMPSRSNARGRGGLECVRLVLRHMSFRSLRELELGGDGGGRHGGDAGGDGGGGDGDGAGGESDGGGDGGGGDSGALTLPMSSPVAIHYGVVSSSEYSWVADQGVLVTELERPTGMDMAYEQCVRRTLNLFLSPVKCPCALCSCVHRHWH